MTDPSPITVQLAVIGAGPAGLAAALAAAEAGARVVIIDSAAQEGGQYWRHLPPAAKASEPGWAHRDFDRAEAQLAAIRDNPAIEVRSATAVVFARTIATGVELATRPIQAAGEYPLQVIHCSAVLIATGAHDRSLPFPGWDIPGVMTPGAAQALLKGHHVLAGKRVAVAGTGVFLLPVAAGLAQAGAQVVGLYEASSPSRWARMPGTALRQGSKIGELTHYLRVLRTHHVPLHNNHAVLAAHHGEDGELASIEVARVDKDGRERSERTTVAVDALAVGYGFTPNIDLAQALGAQVVMDELDGAPAIGADEHGRTNVESVFVAGEVTGVGGSVLAEIEGQLAGWAAAEYLVGPAAVQPFANQRTALLRKRATAADFAHDLKRAYPLTDGWMDRLQADTVICRCEEVTAGQVVHAVSDLGVDSLRALKLSTRVGMGPCQGRICTAAAARLVAHTSHGSRPSDVGAIAAGKRLIAVPTSLASLASLPADLPAGRPWGPQPEAAEPPTSIETSVTPEPVAVDQTPPPEPDSSLYEQIFGLDETNRS